MTPLKLLFVVVPTDVPADTPLTAITGDTGPIGQWTTNFHLALVVVDPYTYESSWILETGGRILRDFAAADCRCGFLATCGADDARQFLGPYVDEMMVFVDPDRKAVEGMGLELLPAFVHINVSHAIESKAEGWDPEEWRAVSEHLAAAMDWRRPRIPMPTDPVPFSGTPALG